MKIYIAAPYAARDALRPYAESLKNVGHTITASWLDATHEINSGTLETAPSLGDDYAAAHSLKDIAEVKDSDLLILVTWDTACRIHGRPQEMGANSGGRHIETGVALAENIPVVLWGLPENIFHRGVALAAYLNWTDLLVNVVRPLNTLKENFDGK